MKKLTLIIFLILLFSEGVMASSLIHDSSGTILSDSAGQMLYTQSGPLIISDTGTYSYEVVDCEDTTSAVGVTVSGVATLENFTVVRCPGGAFVFNESATLKNSIGISTGADITIATGKTVTGTSNLFGDSGKAGSGTYTNVAGTQWSTDPLFISASDSHLQPSSPAINAGVNLCTGAGVPFSGCTGAGTGTYTDYENHPVPIGPYSDVGAYEQPYGKMNAMAFGM